MANLKLNSVTLATEAGGTVSLDSAIVYPVGHVIKTEYGSHSTESNSGGSTSFVATGLYASITPASTSNKILIHCQTSCLLTMSGTVGYLTIYADHASAGTMVNIAGGAGYANIHDANPTSATDILMPASLIDLHSPGVEDVAVRYELYVKHSNASGNINWSQNGSKSTIILQEIVG